ncbi:MAG: DUF11 domain-containing protein [Betaproteobacteria bacterium]|nr:DUF11 domain-containing protein [Betaproteobacteria bacterium]MBK8917453.1 DUF11 domain-containing protein [Betaproteobacteria bacterium]
MFRETAASNFHDPWPTRTRPLGTAASAFLRTVFRLRRLGSSALLGIAFVLCGGSAWAGLGTSVTLFSGDPTDIYPGETTRLEITLSNSNTAAAITAAAFANSLPGTLPNGLQIAGAATYTCTDPATAITSGGSGSLTAIPGTQAIALSGGVIPARANNTDGICTVRIPVSAGTSTGTNTTYTYTIDDGAVTGSDGSPVANAGEVNQSINVSAIARPTLAKNFAASTLVLGGNSTTLTVTLSNTNPVPIPDFTISDAFPLLGGSAIIRVASPTGASASCNLGGAAPSFAPNAGDTTITASGTIPAQSGATPGRCTLTVAVEAAQSNGLFSTGVQNNTINATSQFSNGLGITAAANATAAMTVRSPLRVSKAFAHSALASGQSDSFTITLTNDGNTPLTVASFTDDPIDGTTAGNSNAFGLKVTGQSTSCAGGVVAPTANDTGVTLTGGTIPAAGSCIVTVNFTGISQTAGVPVTYTNTVAAGAVDVGDPAIVSQSTSAAVLVADDLRVLKSATPSQAAPGNPVRYTVTVQNYSASAIANAVVTDHLANGMTFLTGTIGSNDYTPSLSGTGCSGLAVSGAVGSATPVLTIGTLPARSDANTPGACVVTFWAMTATGAANGSSTANTLNAGDVCYNAGATCNGSASGATSGTVNTTMLSASKAFNPAGPVSEGTISTLTVTLSNLSANPLTAVSLSDTLPLAGGGQLRIADPANAASTCGSPTLTATPGSTSLSMNGGTIPARASGGTGAAGTCFVNVDVVGPAGVFNNTATVAGSETYANGSSHLVGPVASNTATLTYTPALAATKSFSPTSVSSGGRATVTVRLSNTGTAVLTGAAVTDPLPSGMVIASPANAYTTCSGSTAITATPGASSAALSGADIASGGNCDFLFDVIATGSANWTNTIPAGNISASGGVQSTVAVSGTLNFNAPTSLTVAKATNPSTLTFPGQVSRLSITLNNGTLAVTGLALTDRFTLDGTGGTAANGMAIAAVPAATTTCPGGQVSATAGGTSVSLAGASLAANASCTFSVNVTSNAVGGITNFIPAGAISTDQGLSNSGQATTSLTTQSNIGVVKQFIPGVVRPGERSRLRVTFYNPTATPLASVSVTDTLPAGVTVPAGPNPTTTCTGASVSSPASNQVLISGGTVAAASGGVAASCHAEIDVLVSAEGDYVNTIAAGAVSASAGGTAATNSQPTSDTLRAKAPLVIHKAFAGATLDTGNPSGFTTGTALRQPGVAATLTVRIENPNTTALTGAAFTDTLPGGLVVAPTPNAATTCTSGTVLAQASGTTIRLAGATVPAAGFCTVTVDVLSNISGTYTNTLAAGSVTTYEGVSNGEATQAVVVVSTPPTVAKQFSPAVVPAGGTSTLTLVLGNTNASAVTLSAALVDTLPTAPGNVVVATNPGMSTSCPGTVTATPGSGTITYASGAQIPAGGCTISVDVTAATTGSHSNVIAAGALQTDLGNNPQAANATLVVSALGYISGRVFRDNSLVPDGIYQSGTDTPISGTSLELRSGSTCAGALVTASGLTNPTTSDALGNYLFAGLPAGTYSVCEPVQPTGTSNGITTAGSIVSANGSTGVAGTASNPSATSSRIAGIVLNGDGGTGEVSGSTGNDFAEVVLSSISGTVFLDHNNNGVQGGADTGIAGVTIQLLDSLNALVATTVSDANGQYSFTGLAPGTYSVREPTQPANTSNGITSAGAVANGGTSGTATAVTSLPSQIVSIVLPPNTAASANNFAEIPNGRTVSGVVFLDYNNNGTINTPADHGIAGQTLTLTGNDVNGNPVSMTTTTAADGSYTFTGVPEGSAYTVTQASQPTGTTNGIPSVGSAGGSASNPTAVSSVISGINLSGANTVAAANNFAEVPGAAPDLAVAKAHTPTSFAEGGSTGYYTLSPSNIGTVATTGTLTLVDTIPAGMTATAASGSGWTCGIAGQTVTCTSAASIAAGASGNSVLVRVTVAGGLAGQILTNTVNISGGGEPSGFSGNNTAQDPTPIAQAAAVQGTIWRDLDHDRILDAGEAKVAGWLVELLQGGNVVSTATTDAAGAYAFTGVAPGSGYQVRFREPTTGTLYGRPVPNEDGTAYSNGVASAGNPAGADNSAGILDGLTLLAGTTTIEQSLPLDPNGVIYDSVTRNPVAGALVTLSGPAGLTGADVLGGSLSQTTGANGFYQFLLLATAPAGTYTLTVTAPGGYLPAPSTTIPACNATLNVLAAPDPALVQNANVAPSTAAPLHAPGTCPANSGALAGSAASTQYYFTFVIDPALPSANVVNNHIPLDPVLRGAIVVTKTTPLVNVSKGDLVPYTVTATNTLSSALAGIEVRDQIPPGFKYRTGSARLNGLAVEPAVAGRILTWANQNFAAGERKTYKMVLVVGSGVSEGEYVNRAWAVNGTVGTTVSNVASATVRVVPDPTFDCSDLIGKVFDDRNANGYQDDGEPGIANVRVATVRGLLVTSDAEGRFHVACADIPQAERGSNFIMKLDERTLPTGYRLTTENPRVVRTTRGKMVRLNFGATVHKVVRMEIDRRAFGTGGDALLPQWNSRLEALLPQFMQRPTILRIAYRLSPGEAAEDAQRRTRALIQHVRDRHGHGADGSRSGPPPLVIEAESMAYRESTQ